MPVSPFTRERLSEAAASSRTLSEALVKLGVDPKGSRRTYLRERMRLMKIDTSHFANESARWTKEVLEPAVAASTNFCEVLRYLGLEVVGGHHTHITRRIRALGIDTSHFTGRNRTKPASRRRCGDRVLVEMPASGARRVQSSRLKAAMLSHAIAEKCTLCGTGPDWHGNTIPLEVDHIDGNWRNNRLENLRLLCPNCHSVTDSYRGRNKKRRPTRASSAEVAE
ncbi:HNH endonuclease signature motif containing protein [Streptomyces chrestomyceticus]|uniref:HNH endonuclease signature motif containing protein n=1 Tax=Streptomyces chrestomyceticus TaxID=68185 RepID=UPI0019D1AD6E|nr:HNH endonuclease signature motif containing protein [Streptomyces chrestomyceticus]